MIGIPGKECDVMVAERFGPPFPVAEYQKECSGRITSLVDAGIPLKPGAIERSLTT
jgi:hypothetical protein